jgi:4-amino-4-deoxy-L-arabinose transferase-like glycosyltransferase
VGLVLVVVLAAWLRLRDLDLVEFTLDESVAVDLARGLLDGRLPSVGLTSSVGALNPPLFVYLMAVPLALRDDPLAATAFVGLLAAVAVAFTYVVLRPRFGALAAIVAAGLFATAPWAVLYGRKIWAQDLLPVFTTSLLWSMFVVLERPRSRAVMLIPILLCVAFQLNFSALGLVIPAALLLLYRAREVHWRAFLGGVVVAVLLLAPWLVHEARHRFEDVATLLAEGRGGHGSAVLGVGSVDAVRQTFRLVGARGWDYVVGASHAAFVSDAGAAWSLGKVASWVAAGLLVVGLGTSTVRIVRTARLGRSRPFVELDLDGGRRALMLAWLVGIWLSYVTSSADRVYPHYLIVAYPVAFAFQGLGLADLVAMARGRGRPAAKVVAFVLLTTVMAAYVAFTLSFHRFLDEHGGAAGDYGIVYRDEAAVARFASERGLGVEADPVLDYLTTRQLSLSGGTGPSLRVRNRLMDATPLPCAGEVRRYGALEACAPATAR